MKHSLARPIGVAVLAALLLAGAVQAATTVYFHDGPNWHQSGNYYSFGVCADTTLGEKVYMQYTTDGTPLTNPPNTGSGTKLLCTFTNNTTCPVAQYWTCTLGATTGGGPMNYRFYVMNAQNQFYGIVSVPRAFTVGELAVTLNTLDAQPSAPEVWTSLIMGLLLVTVAVVGALSVIVWRSRA